MFQLKSFMSPFFRWPSIWTDPILDDAQQAPRECQQCDRDLSGTVAQCRGSLLRPDFIPHLYTSGHLHPFAYLPEMPHTDKRALGS